MKLQRTVLSFICLLSLVFSGLAFGLGQEGTDFNLPGRVNAIAWSPDGRQIAVAGGNDVCTRNDMEQFAILILDAYSLEVVEGLQGHTCPVLSVTWSPDGARLASGGYDGAAIIWDVGHRRRLTTAQESTFGRSTMDWQPDGLEVATSLIEDNRVEIFDSDTGDHIFYFWGHDGYSHAVAWSPDGQSIASGGMDNLILIWDASNGEIQMTLQGHTGSVRSVDWSPDGTEVVSASNDTTARIWNVDGGEIIHVLEGHTQAVEMVRWNPNRSQIATASLDGTVRIWDGVSGEQLATYQSSQPVYAVDWSPDGRQLVYGGEIVNDNEIVQIVDVADTVERDSS